MAQRLEFSQTQKQTLKLTQSMQQSLQILQKNTLELADYLQDQVDSNPLMELRTHFERNMSDLSRIKVEAHFDLYSFLYKQVYERGYEDYEHVILMKLILNVNKNGYLQINHDAFCEEYGINEKALKQGIHELQSLEPHGIGAESIRECLIIQTEADQKAPLKTSELLRLYYHQFLNQDWPDLKSELLISQPELNEIINYLASLSLQPGNPEGQEAQNIIPDLIFLPVSGHLKLRFNVAGQFQLAFDDSSFLEMTHQIDHDTEVYIRRGKRTFRDLQQALILRQETLLSVGEHIVKAQFEYLSGRQDYIDPYTMTALANELQIDVSTVSRAVDGKYIQTIHGIIPLARLCSGRPVDNSSAPIRKIDRLVTQIVENEDKLHPLSDTKIQKALANQGITVSRRLVTKVRERLDIRSSTQRKML